MADLSDTHTRAFTVWGVGFNIIRHFGFTHMYVCVHVLSASLCEDVCGLSLAAVLPSAVCCIFTFTLQKYDSVLQSGAFCCSLLLSFQLMDDILFWVFLSLFVLVYQDHCQISLTRQTNVMGPNSWRQAAITGTQWLHGAHTRLPTGLPELTRWIRLQQRGAWLNLQLHRLIKSKLIRKVNV